MKGSGKKLILAATMVFCLQGAVQAEEAKQPEQASKDVPVINVEVTADQNKAEKTIKSGSAEAGYITQSIDKVGPWSNLKLQDTPYSINVISSDFMENIQARMMDDIVKVNPLLQFEYSTTRNGGGSFQIRGIRNYITSLEDGVRIGTDAHTGIFLEDAERAEVISGLSGFLYGPGNTGGTINYVLKRPTKEAISKMTVSSTGENYYVHGDFGGPLSEDNKFGYRLNFATTDGDGDIQNSKLKRQMASLALDWHATDKVLLQFDASAGYMLAKDHQQAFQLQGTTVPDASKLDNSARYTPDWRYEEVKTHKAGVNAKWNLSDSWDVRAAYRHRVASVSGIDSQVNIYGDDTLTQRNISISFPYYTIVDGYYVFVDGKQLETGSVKHNITFGASGDIFKTKTSGSINLSPGINYPTPTSLTDFALPAYNQNYVTTLASKTKFSNLIVGDDVTFNAKWSALLGLSHTTIDATSFNTAGAVTSKYNNSATTPNVSLLYKVDPSLTLYATYIEALDQGTTAPTTAYGSPVVNAGQVFSPIVSTQYEIGAKKMVGQTFLTAALYKINKASGFTDPNTLIYAQDGEELHEGFEFTATGKVSDRLTVVGGFTLENNRYQKVSNAAWLGRRTHQSANFLAKLYAEYKMPRIEGLYLTGGIYYVGDFCPVTTAVVVTYPATVSCDFGVRYETKIKTTPVTYRLNVTNVFDKTSWTTAQYLNSPRTITLSASFGV